MKKIIITWIRVFCRIFICGSNGIIALNTDQEALQLIYENQNTYIGVMWPNTAGDELIDRQIISSHCITHYEKNILFTRDELTQLLTRIHKDSQKIEIYFPPGSSRKFMKVYLLEAPSLNICVACKRAIRDFYQLHPYAMHINNLHSETIELAEIFFK